jgi:hypothetical protein
MTFYIKQNDTSPVLLAKLQEADGSAVKLTNASVRFHMRPVGRAAITIDEAASIVNAGLGVVEYAWKGENTSTIGSYQAEFQVNYNDGSVETFPNNGYIRVEIIDDIT